MSRPYDNTMLCIKIATLGTDKYPTLVRLSICRFHIDNDRNTEYESLKKRCLNLHIDPKSQGGDKTLKKWENNMYAGYSNTATSSKDIHYRDIPKYIQSYCKKFDIDINTVLVWDDCNKVRDVLDKIEINPFKHNQWLDINTAITVMTCGQTVYRNFCEIPSYDVASEVYGFLKLIHTGHYQTHNPDDDIPF